MTNPSFLTKSSIPESSVYLSQVGDEHRKRFGQFFTHPTVAEFMVKWVLESGYTSSLYDPGFGLGAFYNAVADDKRVEFRASEIDPAALDFWEESTGCDASFIAREDYLLSWGRRHTNIICNPPYMRFQKFLNRDKVFRSFASNTGWELSGYTNIASAFLLKSLFEMDGNGRMAYIMPLEFLNTGYGNLVKSKLIEGGHLVALIKLDCEKDVFPDATTSVGIILYDASVYHSTVSFYSLTSVDALQTLFDTAPVARIEMSELEPDFKWLQYFAEGDLSLDVESLTPLSDYGRFSRGIATGANQFFVLQPSAAKRMQLNETEFLPCITRSSQLKQLVFSLADYGRLVRRDAPVLLFSAQSEHSPAAERYIRSGESDGYHERFLTKNRTPWYKTEVREPAPILIGVFSRGGYKVVRNRSDAVNLTCFHGFQPNCRGRSYLDHLFLYFASQPGRRILALSTRKYGDALDKFEPNDLNRSLVPNPAAFDELGIKAVEHAMSHVEENDCVPDHINAFFSELVNVIE